MKLSDLIQVNALASEFRSLKRTLEEIEKLDDNEPLAIDINNRRFNLPKYRIETFLKRELSHVRDRLRNYSVYTYEDEEQSTAA